MHHCLPGSGIRSLRQEPRTASAAFAGVCAAASDGSADKGWYQGTRSALMMTPATGARRAPRAATAARTCIRTAQNLGSAAPPTVTRNGTWSLSAISPNIDGEACSNAYLKEELRPDDGEWPGQRPNRQFQPRARHRGLCRNFGIARCEIDPDRMVNFSYAQGPCQSHKRLDCASEIVTTRFRRRRE